MSVSHKMATVSTRVTTRKVHTHARVVKDTRWPPTTRHVKVRNIKCYSP